MKFVDALRKLVSRNIQPSLQPAQPITDSPQAAYARTLSALMDVEPWCFDYVKFDGELIEIRGWAIAPEGDHSRVSFMINNKEFEHIDYPLQLDHHNIGQLFWYYPGAKDSGFVCRMKISSDQAFPEGYAVFKYVDKVSKEPLKEEHNYFFASEAINQTVPIPDAPRRVRVHGGDSEIAFLLEGFATYMKLKLALEKTLQKSFADFSHILDWGCGCGRLTRYLHNLKNAFITGIDIDADNIGWCQRNLPFGEFLTIPLHPPTELRTGVYDLLIGISIFTHLREKEQFEWLRELYRLAADGGILLMTVHGDTTIGRSNLPAPFFNELQEKGFLDIGRNPNLDGAILDEDYYRNTYHTHEYIRDRWSKHFEVIDIIPGYIGNHQDLVIMRK